MKPHDKEIICSIDQSIEEVGKLTQEFELKLFKLCITSWMENHGKIGSTDDWVYFCNAFDSVIKRSIMGLLRMTEERERDVMIKLDPELWDVVKEYRKLHN